MTTKDNIFFPASTDEVLKSRVVGDAAARFVINANGDLEWGDGTSATDVVLTRSAADTLQVASGDSLDLSGHNGATVGLKLGGTLVTATAAEINNACDTSTKLVNLTAATLTLAEATHGGSHIVTVNKADGTAITLPAASGSGAHFRLFVGTTITSNTTTIKVANSSDTMVGFQTILQDGGSTALLFEIGSTDDTITLDGSTKGGIKGDWIELIDIATNLWFVRETLSGTSTEVINTSATV